MKKLCTIFAIYALLACSFMAQAQPKVIAHRGYWNTEGSARNSIRALIKADSIGCYGSEFDVWLTADSVLVINHDPVFDGIVIEKNTAAAATACKLANGENLPTLEQFLNVAKDLNIKLICEIKAHDSNTHEQEAIRRVLDTMKRFGLEDRVEYVTFSRNGLLQLIANVPPGTPVQYPAGDYTPAQMRFFGGSGLNYKCATLRNHPEWLDECRKNGIAIKVWKILNDDDLKWCIDNNVDFITSDDPEKHILSLRNLNKK